MTEPSRKGAGNVRHWQYLTGREFKALDLSKTVVTVTCSPMEVHGPHLPVVTDNLEAESLTTRAIEMLGERHPEILFVRLPPIYVAADVLPHLGSLMFRTSTIVRVMSDLGRTLAKQGFKNVWVASFHGGPRHFLSIEQACHLTNKRYGARMVSLFSILAKRLTEGTANLAEVLGRIDGLTVRDLDGDVHAGAVETSMLLHLLGDCVDGSYKTAPQMTVDLKRAGQGKPPRAAKPGRASFPQLMRGFAAGLKYFQEETYAGKPSIATPEIGREILDILARHCADTLSEIWTGKLSPEECHSPIWPARRIFLSPAISRVFERVAGYRNPIF